MEIYWRIASQCKGSETRSPTASVLGTNLAFPSWGILGKGSLLTLISLYWKEKKKKKEAWLFSSKLKLLQRNTPDWVT